jgi:CubicO group peptidase (beta-lactamase class C family)
MKLIKKNSFLAYVFVLMAFVASACRLEAQALQARHNLTPAEFQSTFNDLFKQGYRLKQMTGYVSNGERYAGLWLKESGPEWQARNGLSAADFQKNFDDFFKQGYRLTWVSGHEAGGSVRYEGIWEKKPGPEWQARNNMTSAEYQQSFDSFQKQGYRLVHVYGYSSGGSARFAAIWEKSSGPAYEARDNMTAAQFQKTFDDFSKQGYRLKDISGYNAGGTDYYTGIWEKTGGSWWWARNGTPDAWYQNVFDNFYYQGYQPIFITAFTSGGAGKINSIWDNSNFSAADLQLISSKITAYMNANQVPGLALAITKDDRLVYAAGFGYADKESGEEAGPTSLFRIASVSKQFTSAAVMKLIEAKTLDVGERVFGPNSILGSEFPTPSSNQKINQITVKHLLEHVSGLTDTPDDPMFDNLSYNHSQLISWVLNDPTRKMTRDANTQWEYLNFGYCLLGRVIEKKTHKSYEQYVRESVLTPSGISDMAIGANSPAQRKPREVKYYPADAYNLNVTRFDSHGGWVASPIDLARFLVRVDGGAAKPDILTIAARSEMLTAPHIKDNKGNDPNYGFGWFVSPQWHNGCMEGTIAQEEVLPNGFTFAFVVNTRPANDGCAGVLAGVVQNLIQNVSAWPKYDLF